MFRILLGPFILCFGGFILIGSCGILGFQAFSQYETIPEQDGPIKNQYQDGQIKNQYQDGQIKSQYQDEPIKKQYPNE